MHRTVPADPGPGRHPGSHASLSWLSLPQAANWFQLADPSALRPSPVYQQGKKRPALSAPPGQSAQWVTILRPDQIPRPQSLPNMKVGPGRSRSHHQRFDALGRQERLNRRAKVMIAVLSQPIVPARTWISPERRPIFITRSPSTVRTHGRLASCASELTLLPPTSTAQGDEVIRRATMPSHRWGGSRPNIQPNPGTRRHVAALPAQTICRSAVYETESLDLLHPKLTAEVKELKKHTSEKNHNANNHQVNNLFFYTGIPWIMQSKKICWKKFTNKSVRDTLGKLSSARNKIAHGSTHSVTKDNRKADTDRATLCSSRTL